MCFNKKKCFQRLSIELERVAWTEVFARSRVSCAERIGVEKLECGTNDVRRDGGEG